MMTDSLFTRLFIIAILFSLSILGFAQEDDGELVSSSDVVSKSTETELGVEQAKQVSTGDLLTRQQTAINNPFDMRDPFKRNLPKRGRLKKNLGNRYFNGQQYTNIDSIEGVPLEQIRVVGVLLGTSRRAIVKLVDPELEQRLLENPNAPIVQDSRTFVVKEGMKLGIDGAEVRAILPGGIVLVEKIRNVYDQDEFLETIIPVSE